jgi:AraC-like DNA-binding protein
MRAALAAALILEPGLGAVLDAFESPGVCDTLLGIHAEMLLISIESAAAAPALMGAFMHAKAGTQVLGALLLTSEADVFPPYRAGPITLSSLAARFGVSRAHLRRMFEGGARQGLTRLEADGRVTFAPAAREQLTFIYAGQLAALVAAGTMTARARGLAGMGAGT